MLRIALLASLTACSQYVPPKPTSPSPAERGLRADEHLDEAREHTRRATALSRGAASSHNEVGRFDDPSSGLWYRSWAEGDEQRALAATHRSAAADLHGAYDEACAPVSPDVIRMSLLSRYGRGGRPTADGVIVYLSPEAGPPDRLLAELRCHRTWMMLSHNIGMDECPLDLPNLRIEAHGDRIGISIQLHVRDAGMVPEVQRRAAHELSLAKRDHTAL